MYNTRMKNVAKMMLKIFQGRVREETTAWFPKPMDYISFVLVEVQERASLLGHEELRRKGTLPPEPRSKPLSGLCTQRYTYTHVQMHGMLQTPERPL